MLSTQLSIISVQDFNWKQSRGKIRCFAKSGEQVERFFTRYDSSPVMGDFIFGARCVCDWRDRVRDDDVAAANRQ